MVTSWSQLAYAFCKYLLPDYALEFGEHLRKYVSDNLVTWPTPPSAECVNQRQGMQLLYGAKVLPDSLLTVLNGPVGALHHFGTGPGERDVVETLLARELERACMKAEEKPVTTRFWLFGDCVAALFRWVLLGLPPRYILKTGSTNPRARMRRRWRLDPPALGQTPVVISGATAFSLGSRG